MTPLRNAPFCLAVLLLSACSPPAPKVEEHEAKPAPAVIDTLSDGMHSYHDAEGHRVMEGEMRDQRRTGVWTSYAPSGKVRSRSEYVDGLLEGPTVVFRDDGALYYTGQYRHGKESGEWHFFDPKGAEARVVRYDSTGTPMR